jgi:hypothetical protein
LGGTLQRGDIQLFHFQHGLHGFGMFDQVRETRWNDLPRKAEFVFQPTTLAFRPAGR